MRLFVPFDTSAMDNPLDSKEEDGGGSLRRLLECHATTTTSNSSNGVDNIETGRIAQTNPFPLPPPDIPQPPVQHPLQPTKPDGIAHWVAKPLDLSLLSASSSIVSRQSSVNTTPRQANRRAASIPQDVTTGARPTTGSTNITHTSSGTSGLLLLTAPSSRSALVTGSGINSIGGTKKKLEDSRDGNAAKLAGNNRKINPKLKQSIIASRTSTTTAAVAGRISSSSAIVRLPTPHPPSHCSLLCCFYAEFDNTVGPKILYQSPHHFMEQDIRSTTVQHMEGLLHKAFYPKATNSNNKPDESATRSSPHTNEHATLEQRSATPKHEKGDDEVDDDDAGAEDATNTTTPLTIFDSCSEYIITGNELTGNIINLSTHHIHVLTRPTTIADEKYERNSLLFCVGFILRRTEDPRPFRPVLSTLALTLREMEVESQFLSRNRSEIQGILESILISLNSQSSECNLLLGKADMLNLKLFLPPKPLARSVKDHDVPILLRRDWQAQSVRFWYERVVRLIFWW